LSLARVLGLSSAGARHAIRAAPLAAIKHGELRQQRHLPMLMLTKAEFDKRSALKNCQEMQKEKGSGGASARAGAKRKRTEAADSDDSAESDDSSSGGSSSGSVEEGAAEQGQGQGQNGGDYLGFR